jgi:hypothetical protein
MRETLRLLRGAQRVSLLLRGVVLDEFVPPLLAEVRRLAAERRDVRVLAAGPPSRDVAQELAEAGAEVRVLDALREVGLLVSDREVMLLAPLPPPDSPMQPTVIVATDPAAVANWQLAFDRAWASALPPAVALAARGMPAAQG